MRFVTVQSPALGGRGDLAVYVPPGHAASPDLPVVVLLHGVYGSFWNWAFNGGAHVVMAGLMSDGARRADGVADAVGRPRRRGHRLPVRPDRRLRSVGDGRRARRAPARRWPASPSASPLFLCGASMGGYGALRLGAHHADRVLARGGSFDGARSGVARGVRRPADRATSQRVGGDRGRPTGRPASGRAPPPPPPRLRPRRSVARRQP